MYQRQLPIELTRYNFRLGIPAGVMEDPRETDQWIHCPSRLCHVIPRTGRWKEERSGSWPYIPIESLLDSSNAHCTTERIGLTKYSTLSYTWGDLTETEMILVDDKPFQVTINLAAFLKTPSKGRAKWDWPLDSPLYL